MNTSLWRKYGLIANNKENAETTAIGPYYSPIGPTICPVKSLSCAAGYSPKKNDPSKVSGKAPRAPPTECISYVEYSSRPTI